VRGRSRHAAQTLEVRGDRVDGLPEPEVTPSPTALDKRRIVRPLVNAPGDHVVDTVRHPIQDFGIGHRIDVLFCYERLLPRLTVPGRAVLPSSQSRLLSFFCGFRAGGDDGFFNVA
jgi:hypothetical protein